MPLDRSLLTLQRHLRALTQFAYVESWSYGRRRCRETAFDALRNPCVRSACFRSVAVGLMGDFSVMLFRPHFMLASEGHPMKVHKNQWLLTMPSPRAIPCGATNRGQTMAPEAQTPAQCPDTGLSLENRAYKPLRIKCFHGVSSGNQHPYLLKSRYGKVR